MDPELLRFGYEETVLKKLANWLDGSVLLSREEARQSLQQWRNELFGEAVRITEDLLPAVHSLYRDCLFPLGVDWQGDLFVQHSPVYNASVFAHAQQFDLVVSSALLQDFSPEELRFVIGHELGHVLFEHSRLPVNAILGRTGGVEMKLAVLLLQWSRAKEISADRVGLLCCGKLTAAVTALFRTSSGLSGIPEDRVMRSFRAQFDTLKQEISQSRQLPGWAKTHPLIPIRFKALELCALDILALRQNPQRFSQRGFAAVDRQIAFILDGLEAHAPA